MAKFTKKLKQEFTDRVVESLASEVKHEQDESRSMLQAGITYGLIEATYLMAGPDDLEFCQSLDSLQSDNDILKAAVLNKRHDEWLARSAARSAKRALARKV